MTATLHIQRSPIPISHYHDCALTPISMSLKREFDDDCAKRHQKMESGKTIIANEKACPHATQMGTGILSLVSGAMAKGNMIGRDNGEESK